MSRLLMLLVLVACAELAVEGGQNDSKEGTSMPTSALALDRFLRVGDRVDVAVANCLGDAKGTIPVDVFTEPMKVNICGSDWKLKDVRIVFFGGRCVSLSGVIEDDVGGQVGLMGKLRDKVASVGKPVKLRKELAGSYSGAYAMDVVPAVGGGEEEATVILLGDKASAQMKGAVAVWILKTDDIVEGLGGEKGISRAAVSRPGAELTKTVSYVGDTVESVIKSINASIKTVGISSRVWWHELDRDGRPLVSVTAPIAKGIGSQIVFCGYRSKDGMVESAWVLTHGTMEQDKALYHWGVGNTESPVEEVDKTGEVHSAKGKVKNGRGTMRVTWEILRKEEPGFPYRGQASIEVDVDQ